MFLHTYLPDAIAFRLGPFTVHWYGLLLALGVVVGYLALQRLATASNILPQERASSVYVNLVIWGFVGARLYHVLNELGFYWRNPARIISVWNGGLAIHGAIIAGVLVLAYYAKKYRHDFWRLADLYVIPLALGQAIGRWGNYFNQELFGKPTSLPWGIPIAIENRPLGFAQHEFFHPAFLYESLWNVAVFAVLYFLYTKKHMPAGMVFWLYLGLYSLGRMGVELLRIDQTPLVFGARLPLAVSGVLFVIALLVVVRKITKNQFVPITSK